MPVNASGVWTHVGLSFLQIVESNGGAIVVLFDRNLVNNNFGLSSTLEISLLEIDIFYDFD